MNSKRTIMILILVLTIGIVGLTIAYLYNSSTITNTFNTKPYGTTVTEEFVSPDNWLPGTSTDKSLTVTNSGQVDEAVRISYTEVWTSKSAKNNDEEGDLPLQQNGNTAALIHFTNTDDWTTVTENGTTYRYYNYKLEPNQTTSELLDYVTFNSAITNSSNCTTRDENGTKTITCNSTGNGYDDATYKLTFTIETIQYDKYKTAWGTNVNIASMKPMNASQLALKSNPVSVTNYTDGNVHEMYTFEHDATEQTPALTDYRYIGNDPYNYVYFNCDDLNNQNSDTCEVWRIIGVFDVERPDSNDNTQTITERRMKLVRGEILKNDYWNTAVNSNNGYNDWTADNVTLKLFLNGDYYNGIAENGLKQSARGMIGTAVYYLGASNSYGTAEELYAWERGVAACGACNSDINKLIWTGEIALSYPSDEYLVYGNGVNETCYGNTHYCSEINAKTGWVYKSNIIEGQSSPVYTWLLAPYSIYEDYAFFISSDGYLGSAGVDITYGVRPTLYLSSSVKIIDGDGSVNNPYWLSNS